MVLFNNLRYIAMQHKGAPVRLQPDTYCHLHEQCINLNEVLFKFRMFSFQVRVSLRVGPAVCGDWDTLWYVVIRAV